MHRSVPVYTMRLLSLFCFFLVYNITSAEETVSEEFITANNQFTSSVYEQLSKNEKGNFLVSPFSAETVLAFVLSGARGNSADELRQALRLPNDLSKIELSLKSTLSNLTNNNRFTFQAANKLYVKNNFTLKDEFQKAGREVYFAESETIDFGKNVEAAKSMNDWVEENTNKKITNLIKSEDLDIWTRVILINALYFKANWSNPFALIHTRNEKFYKTINDTVDVVTLRHFGKNFKHYECPHLNARFLELPFQGREASMVIVLPNEKDGLASVETQLDKVFSTQHELKPKYLNVYIPKFKIETSIDFNKVLENLGVSEIFDETRSDLSGVSGVKGDLYLNKVSQKTFIDVNEEGVEAAAATFALISVPRSGHIGRPDDFKADHPFIFFIKINNCIVFAGRVTDPSQ